MAIWINVVKSIKTLEKQPSNRGKHDILINQPLGRGQPQGKIIIIIFISISISIIILMNQPLGKGQPQGRGPVGAGAMGTSGWKYYY